MDPRRSSYSTNYFTGYDQTYGCTLYLGLHKNSSHRIGRERPIGTYTGAASSIQQILVRILFPIPDFGDFGSSRQNAFSELPGYRVGCARLRDHCFST